MARKRYYDNKSERSQEAKDSGIISEDRSSWANLPQDVIHKDWPRSPHGASYELDDTIGGIDEQIGKDTSQMRKHKSKSKY